MDGKEIQAEMEIMANKDLQDEKVIQDKMAYQVLRDLQDKEEQMVIYVESRSSRGLYIASFQTLPLDTHKI